MLSKFDSSRCHWLDLFYLPSPRCWRKIQKKAKHEEVNKKEDEEEDKEVYKEEDKE